MNARYELLAPIAEGGTGSVYKARDLQTGSEVALKRVLTCKTGGCGTAVDALIREAQQQSALQHPNIVAVHDFGLDAEGGYIVMELVRGETLEAMVMREALKTADFDALVRQTLEGMRAVHARGILHLDLKPGNLMVRRLPDGGLQVKILDFGLAQTLPRGKTQTPLPASGLPGSVHFMAPEQFERAPADARMDIYALGCLFYYALTQRHPFEGETKPQVMVAHLHHRTQPLGTLRPDLPASTVQWVERLMSRQPADRPASISEALRDYETPMAARGG
ncbi:serine/threonine-protein kinase [Prosthecobacter fluviatilis]|uniref:Serine/threonine-protein kinase n=1 Tax=Prosthecobacter fluviatilis TaxID=445931 RepID=A0ABW0KKY2_9BACT